MNEPAPTSALAEAQVYIFPENAIIRRRPHAAELGVAAEAFDTASPDQVLVIHAGQATLYADPGQLERAVLRHSRERIEAEGLAERRIKEAAAASRRIVADRLARYRPLRRAHLRRRAVLALRERLTHALVVGAWLAMIAVGLGLIP